MAVFAGVCKKVAFGAKKNLQGKIFLPDYTA